MCTAVPRFESGTGPLATNFCPFNPLNLSCRCESDFGCVVLLGRGRGRGKLGMVVQLLFVVIDISPGSVICLLSYCSSFFYKKRATAVKDLKIVFKLSRKECRTRIYMTARNAEMCIFNFSEL